MLVATDGGWGWAQKALTIEMDQVGRGVRYPYFRFPCDLAEIAAHDGPVRKRGHINEARRRLANSRESSA